MPAEKYVTEFVKEAGFTPIPDRASSLGRSIPLPGLLPSPSAYDPSYRM